VVTVDADGFTRIVDRVKELIITGGFNVSPTEVEQVLVSHPDIADAAVVGMPDGSGGERVTAAVLLDEGATIGHAELRAWCKERLAGYKVPREVYVVDELPRSMLGKVLRAKVREQLADLTPLPYDARQPAPHEAGPAARSAVGRPPSRSDEAELADGVALLAELGDRGVDAAARELVDLQALDDLPVPVDRAGRERGDQALRHAVGA